MNQIDVNTIDKSNFVCLQSKNKSVYFGEVQYLTAQDQLINKKDDPEAPNKGKPIRHGFGIQIDALGENL